MVTNEVDVRFENLNHLHVLKIGFEEFFLLCTFWGISFEVFSYRIVLEEVLNFKRTSPANVIRYTIHEGCLFMA